MFDRTFFSSNFNFKIAIQIELILWRKKKINRESHSSANVTVQNANFHIQFSIKIELLISNSIIFSFSSKNCRIEEAKRAMKRPAPAAPETDRYADLERKRSASDRRFEPPPPPRFDTSIRSSSTYERASEKKRLDDYPPSTASKRNDDYKSSRSSGGGSSGIIADVPSFKRPIDDYPKRSSNIDPPSRSGGSSGAYDRGVPSMNSSGKDHRFSDSVDSRGGSYGRSRVDERDSR